MWIFGRLWGNFNGCPLRAHPSHSGTGLAEIPISSQFPGADVNRRRGVRAQGPADPRRLQEVGT